MYNLGVSRESAGESTTELLKRIIVEAKVREPNLILLTSGINDIRRIGGKDNPPRTSRDEFEKNIHDMIAQTRSVVQEILFISPCQITDKESSKGDFFLNTDLKAYSDITKRVCEEEKVPYLDIFQEWENKDYTSLLCPDGVHPNSKGYEAVFENLKTFLLSLYA